MRKSIKRYELNENISIEKLEENNFILGGYKESIPFPKYFFDKFILDDILIHIEIGINEDESFYFNDFNCVDVLDDNFCQPYYPFYEDTAEFKYLKYVIDEYNKFMDNLVEKEILKEQKLEKQKKLTYKRR